MEFRDADKEKIVNSNNVFVERREFCVDVGAFVLREVAEVAEKLETVNERLNRQSG